MSPSTSLDPGSPEGDSGTYPKAFLIPASDPEARENLKKTVFGKVPLSQIESLPASVRDLAKAASADQCFNVWGCRANKESTWDKLAPGDLCLFYQAGFFVAVGRVAGKVRSAALGKNLWGDSVWEYCYFLSDVEETSIPSAEALEALGYTSGYSTPLGFAIVNRQDEGNGPFQVTPDVMAKLEQINALVTPAIKKAVAAITTAPESAIGNGEEDNEQVLETVNDLDNAGIDLSDEALRDQLAKAGNLTPEQETKLVRRFRRCQKLAKEVKELYAGKCQVCGFTFAKTKSGKPYAEAAHLVALGDGGADTLQNLLCLCPNHHKMLDHGGLEIRWDPEGAGLQMNLDSEGSVSEEFRPLEENKHLGL